MKKGQTIYYFRVTLAAMGLRSVQKLGNSSKTKQPNVELVICSEVGEAWAWAWV